MITSRGSKSKGSGLKENQETPLLSEGIAIFQLFKAKCRCANRFSIHHSRSDLGFLPRKTKEIIIIIPLLPIPDEDKGEDEDDDADDDADDDEDRDSLNDDGEI